MNWALITDGVVAETTDIDPSGRYHPDLVWVPCYSDVTPGYSYINDAFSAPKEPLNIPPTSCTPAQGLVALFALKQITEDDVQAAIDSITDPVQKYTAQIAFKRAVTWDRNSQTMQTMAQLLALSEKDLDELFEYAVTIQA